MLSSRLYWVVGVIVAAVFIVFMFFALPKKCELESHIKLDDTDLCWYDLKQNGAIVSAPTDCRPGEEFRDKRCYYEATNLFESEKFQLWLVISVAAGLIIAAFVAGRVSKEEKKEIKKRDIVSPKRAISLIKKAHNDMFNGFRYGDEIDDSNFMATSEHEPFVKYGHEWMQVEMFVKNMENAEGNGLFTFLLPLTKGEQAIMDWWYRVSKTYFMDYKVRRERPIQEAADRREREIEMLADINPRLAEQRAVEMLKGGTQSGVEVEYPEEIEEELIDELKSRQRGGSSA